MRGGVTGLAVAALVSVTVGCGLPSRTYYDDLEGGDSAVGEDAESSTGDVIVPGNDAGSDALEEAAPGDDSSVDAAQDAPALDSGDGSAPDGGQDAAGDAGDGGDGGCGPLNTIANCGACGHACMGATPVCSGSTCVTGCPAGQANCSASCVDETSDPNNCNGCGLRCATGVLNAHAVCQSSACGFACNANYTACNGACVNEQTDKNNCGGCGIACGTLNATNETCNGGACTYTCSLGHSNCNTAGANTTGCECATPACCGTGCQKVHSNGPSSIGLGQSWDDCVALGTYNVAQATAACVALKGAGGCSGGWTCGSGATRVSQAVICDNACTICWAYATAGGSYPTTAGTVTDCGCPGIVQSATNWQ